MSVLVNCTRDHDDRDKCIAEEKGKKYTLCNTSKFVIRKVKVDGCFPQEVNEKRCDYLMIIESINRAIFIELKGAALTQAVRQLSSTINFLKQELQGYQIDARIIGNGNVPRLRVTTDYRCLAKEIKPNGTIIIRTNSYSEEI
jgi:hypothetical protein